MNPVVSHLITALTGGAAMLAFVITNLDKVERVHALVVGFLARFTARAEKAAVAADIESKVNQALRASTSTIDEAIPYKLKIKWVVTSTREAIIESNEVILKLDYHRHSQGRNVALAIAGYVSKGLLPHARAYVDPAVFQATEFVLVWNMLAGMSKEALDYFFTEILEPALELKAEVRDYYDVVVELDRRGLFMPILLPELVDLGRLLYPTPPTQSIRQETVNFVRFLEYLAKREQGDEATPLSFTGRWIRVAVILVAKAETLELGGIEPHRARAEKYINAGVEKIYFCAMEQNIKYAAQLADIYSGDKRVVRIQRFTCSIDRGGPKRALLVRLEMSPRQRNRLVADVEGQSPSC